MQFNLSSVSSTEIVARILHRDWLVDGVLQLGAFSLRPNETYLSVNRASSNSFDSDVKAFVESHPFFQFSEFNYKRASMNVGDIRNIQITSEDMPMHIDVEVEPRNAHVVSHAGIFTRLEGNNIKPDSVIPAETQTLGLSANDILMEVAWSLVSISTVEDGYYHF